jgi:hypothetical protein
MTVLGCAPAPEDTDATVGALGEVDDVLLNKV